MNEQIEKLINQAWELADKEVSEEDWHTYVHERIFQIKFAELIVRECVEVCNRVYFDNYPDAEDFERSEEGDAIKKHFGVEGWQILF